MFLRILIIYSRRGGERELRGRGGLTTQMSSYGKIPAATKKKEEEKKHWIFLETRDQKMDHLVQCGELIATQWLVFTRLIRADPAIPAPRLSLGAHSPFSLEWLDPKDPKKKIRAIVPERYDSIEVDVTGQGCDNYKKVTPEEAFAAIKAVFSQ
jgi:hypothetical protein